jgi:hypothetical protein
MSRTQKPKDTEPLWWEWLERRPVGTYAAAAIAAGEVVLVSVYVTKIWTLEVAFFVAVGWLTFILGVLSAFAAAAGYVHRHHAAQPKLFDLPDWLRDFEDYFRWLTPVIFVVGIIFGHYFWH